MDTSLQIRNVEIEGFGNLGHVIMRELGDRIILEGVNGVGKTMILTAIRAALEGKTGLPDRPLSEFIGSDRNNALIKIDLANGTSIRFSIRVVITADDFDLQIKEVTEDGKTKKIAGGPIAFLKTVVNAIAFRPQAWRKKSDAEQLEEVFAFFPGLKQRLTANDKELQDAEQERARCLNRSKVLRLDIERVPFSPGLPEKEIDPAALVESLTAANEHNGTLETFKANLKAASDDTARIDDGIKTIQAEKTRTLEMIERLQAQVKQSDIEIEKKVAAKEAVYDRIKLINESIDAFEIKDVEPIKKELSEVKEKNEKIRNNLRLKSLQAELENSELRQSAWYKKITEIKQNRTEIMASAEIPIDGLSIGDGCLLYPNSNMEMVRLSALSDGEFWPVACGLVAAFNPRVRIVIIDNLHDLDKNNFELLCQAAEKYSMQIWIHKTLWDESDAGTGFLIRDGEIVKAAKAK